MPWALLRCSEIEVDVGTDGNELRYEARRVREAR